MTGEPCPMCGVWIPPDTQDWDEFYKAVVTHYEAEHPHAVATIKDIMGRVRNERQRMN